MKLWMRAGSLSHYQSPDIGCAVHKSLIMNAQSWRQFNVSLDINKRYIGEFCGNNGTTTLSRLKTAQWKIWVCNPFLSDRVKLEMFFLMQHVLCCQFADVTLWIPPLVVNSAAPSGCTKKSLLINEIEQCQFLYMYRMGAWMYLEVSKTQIINHQFCQIRCKSWSWQVWVTHIYYINK